MKLVFDENKNAINIAKHGVSLADAEKIEWETLLAIEDKRYDYGEIRIIGYALIEIRLYCVVFTDRENERRIISLRKANSREVKNYVNHS
jgi:uncharacterized DUF497 family protein